MYQAAATLTLSFSPLIDNVLKRESHKALSRMTEYLGELRGTLKTHKLATLLYVTQG